MSSYSMQNLWIPQGILLGRENNIAHLGEHLRELLHNQDKLWVKLHSDKYLRQEHILHISLSLVFGKLLSKLWRP
jgi:hypothetical protein